MADAAESVLEIDPTAHEVSTFGEISSPVKRKWVEGVLARNDKIYAIVRFATLEHTVSQTAHPLPLRIAALRCADGS